MAEPQQNIVDEEATPVVEQPETGQSPVVVAGNNQMAMPSDTEAPVTVREIEQADISKRQQQTVAAPTFDDVVKQIQETGKAATIANVPITPEILQSLGQADLLNLRTAYKYSQPTAEEVTAEPFTLATGEFDEEAAQRQNSSVYGQLYRNHAVRKDVRGILKKSGLEEDIIGTVTNNMVLGSGMYELTQRLAEGGRFVTNIPDFVTNVLPATGVAMYKSGSLLPVGPAFRAEYDAASSAWRENYFSWRDDVRNKVPGATMARYYNETIHDILEKNRDTVAKFQEAGRPLPADLEDFNYEELAYEKDADGNVLMSESGEPVKRRFVSEANAYDIMDASFRSLSRAEQYATIIGEETFYGLLTGGAGMMAASDRIRKIRRFKNDPRFADALRGIDDPERIIEIVGEFETIDKADKFLQIGLAQNRTSNQLKQVNTRVKALDGELLRIKNLNDDDLVDVLLPDGTIAEKKLTAGKYRSQIAGERAQLKSTRMRSFTTGRVLPYIKDATETSFYIGLGTGLARDYGFVFDSPEANEAFGNVFMSVGGYRMFNYGAKKMARQTLSGASGVARKVQGKTGVYDIIRNTVAAIPVVGDIAVDKTVENIQTVLGRTLEGDELTAVKNTVYFYKNMKPEMRQQSLSYMQEGFETHERWISRFPMEKQADARKYLEQAFSGYSGILTLAAAGELNRRQIDLNTLSKYDLAGMEDDLRSMENSFRVTQLALDELANLSSDVDSLATRKVIETFVNTRREGLERLRNEIKDVNRQRLDALGDLETHIITMSDEGIDQETLKILQSYRGSLTESLGEVVDQAKQVKKQRDDLNVRIDTAIYSARKVRDTKYHEPSVNKMLETLLYGVQRRISLRGQQIYRPAIEFAKNQKPFDMKPVVMSLTAGQGESRLIRFFGPQSELFQGRAGQEARQAFIEVAHETVPRSDIAEMRSVLMKKAGSDSALRDRIENMDDLDIVVEMMSRKPDFNPFMTQDPYNMELIRRAFATTAHGYTRSGDAANARIFSSFVESLDAEIARQNPQLDEILTKTRTAYEAEVGVPRTANLYLDQLYQGRQRVLPAHVTGTRGGMSLQGIYAQGRDPLSIMKQWSDEVGSLLKPGPVGNVEGVRQATEQLMFVLGRHVNGQYVFDLTSEAGRLEYKQFSDAMTEVIYNTLGADFLKKHKKIAGTVPRISGGAATALLESIDDSMDAITVGFIRDPNTRKIEYEPALDLFEAVTAHNSFVDALKTQPEVAEAFKDLQQKFKTYKRKASSTIAAATDLEMSSINIMDNILGDFTATKFYDQFIRTGEGGGLRQLKTSFLAAAQAQGMSSKDANRMFKEVTTAYTIQGIYEAAGRSAVAGATVTKDVAKTVDEVFESPQEILRQLESEGVRDALSQVLDDDQIGLITDTMRIINDSSYAVSAKGAIGDYKKPGIAANVSRVWNGVKGFVSPVYIATEYMFTAAKAGQISIFKLTMQNKEAAQIIHKMMATPDLMTRTDFEKFEVIATNYIFSELGPRIEELNAIDENGGVIILAEQTAAEAKEAVVETGEAALDLTKELLGATTP
jgi:hypothetical protein